MKADCREPPFPNKQNKNFILLFFAAPQTAKLAIWILGVNRSKLTSHHHGSQHAAACRLKYLTIRFQVNRDTVKKLRHVYSPDADQKESIQPVVCPTFIWPVDRSKIPLEKYRQSMLFLGGNFDFNIWKRSDRYARFSAAPS